MVRLELHVPKDRPLEDVLKFVKRETYSLAEAATIDDELLGLHRAIMSYIEERKEKLADTGFVLYADDGGFTLGMLNKKPTSLSLHRTYPEEVRHDSKTFGSLTERANWRKT